VTAIDAVRRDSGWAVRAEVVSPRTPAPGDVRGVEERSAKTIGELIELAVRARTDVLVTRGEYRAVGDAQPAPDGAAVASPEAPAP
jgi:hypothetical protein